MSLNKAKPKEVLPIRYPLNSCQSEAEFATLKEARKGVNV